MANLKNASARLTTKPIDKIHDALARKASSVQIDFADGQATAIRFTVNVNGRDVAFRLPARVRAVEIALYGRKNLTPIQKKQAYVTAWANIRDWILAQMALIDTGMVKTEELFLPYMLNADNLTLFEAMEHRQFLLKSGE